MKPRYISVAKFLVLAPIISLILIVFLTNHVQAKTSPFLDTTPMPPTATPTNGELMNRIKSIEDRMDDNVSIIDVQSNSFNATISRIESNSNLLMVIIGIASILLALVGFGVVRLWIRSQVEEQISGITSDEISRLAGEELVKMRHEWEPRFRELYEEYQRVVRR